MNWTKTPEQITNEIDAENGMNWDTDSILCLLTNFIQTNCDEKKFAEYVRNEAKLQSHFAIED